MTDDDEHNPKTRNADLGEIRLPSAKRPSGREPISKDSDLRSINLLRRIADELHVSIDSLAATPVAIGIDADKKDFLYSGQERRLISAFSRIADSAVRDQVIELVEALGQDKQ